MTNATRKSPRTQLVRKGKGGSPSLWTVSIGDECVIGMLEKYRDTTTETHPWKAFRGIGRNQVFLGAFYDEGSVPDGDVRYGGRKAALAAITA